MGFEPGAQMQPEKAATYFRWEIEKDCQSRHSFPQGNTCQIRLSLWPHRIYSEPNFQNMKTD
jgi:hypothetical protein